MNISLKFVTNGSINNIPSLVQIMAWCLPCDKPLSEPMMVRLPTHICVTRPQWVNTHYMDNGTEMFGYSPATRYGPHITYKYSLLMHRIKIKSPAIFYGMNNTFLGVNLSIFNQSYSGGITTTKSLPDIGGTTIQDVGCHGTRHGAWRPHHERWAYTSNFVQYISGF